MGDAASLFKQQHKADPAALTAALSKSTKFYQLNPTDVAEECEAVLGIEDDYREEQLDMLMNHAGDFMETDIPHSRMWGAMEAQLKSKGYFKAVDLKTVLSVAKGRTMPNSGTEFRADSTGNVKWVKTKVNFGDPRTMPYLKNTIKVIQN